MANQKKPQQAEKPNAKTKRKVPRSVQQTIPYSQIYSDGIMLLEDGQYSKSIMFQDINYQIARQDDQENIFFRYGEFLNYFDQNTKVQITINNRSIDKESFAENVLLKRKRDNLDMFREEYNEMLKRQISVGSNEIEREKYITITIKADSLAEARTTFTRLEAGVVDNMRRMGSKAQIMTVRNRLEGLHSFFRGGVGSKIDYDLLKDQGMTTKDIIAPDSFSFKMNHFTMGDKFARALYVNQLPTFLSDKFVASMTEFPFNMMLTMNIQSVAPGEALRLVKRKITGMEANKIEQQKKALKSGYDTDMISHDLKNSLEEAEELLDDLMNKNQKMFLVNIVIVHVADSLEQLNIDSETIRAEARKTMCDIGTLHFQQERALATALPLGNNKLKISRTLTTESTAIFIPFTSQELFQKNGMYYGLNAVSKNLIIFDRLSLKNPNGFILGSPGSGKSFSAKREMINVILNTDDDVMIIDPEREYSRLVENFSGELIHISAGSKNHINPLDMTANYSDDDDPLLMKSEFVLSLCDLLIGGSIGLSAIEKTIIDRCLKKTFQEYVQDFNPNKQPTLLDFQLELEKQDEPVARDLALALEIYTKGSLGIFANRTNININNRLVLFDIKDLGKQLKTMGMLIVLDAIWNRITDNREKGRRTWIYMDEIYLLFTNDYSANFLFELYKRARKWGGVPTGITQNVEDLLKSELARRMLSNSDFLMMLNQATADRAQLAHLLNISDTQLSYVTNSGPGEGLLFSGDSIIPFIDKFPRNTKLYAMMTTKVDELSELNERGTLN